MALGRQCSLPTYFREKGEASRESTTLKQQLFGRAVIVLISCVRVVHTVTSLSIDPTTWLPQLCVQLYRAIVTR